MAEKSIFQEQLVNIVGAENVITDPKVLEGYSRDQSFVEPVMPMCVVKAGNADEVIAVVKACNHHGVAVTPYSSGCNNQGAAIPALGGVVLDVSRMNKVLAIDPVSRNAHIQAGVTFDQLIDETAKIKTELAPYGLRPGVPVELPSSACVISTLIEYNPLWTWSRYAGDENDMLSIPSLILPTGELMKTGLSAVPFVKKPYSDASGTPASFINEIFFGAQGTLGISLEAWVKLFSRQEVNKAIFWPFDKVDNAFKPIMDIKWCRYGFEMFLINQMELALLLAAKLPGDVAGLRKALPPWTLVLILRGRSDEVAYQEEDLKEISTKLGIKMLTELPGAAKAGETLVKYVERPQGWKKTSQYKGARNVMPFMTPQKRIPTFNDTLFKVAKKYKYPIEDIGCLAVPAYPEPGVVHCQYSFARNPNDAAETERVKAMFYEASAELINIGAFFSRPYGKWAEMVYARAGTYHSTVRGFKELVDPKAIMNPGKLLF